MGSCSMKFKPQWSTPDFTGNLGPQEISWGYALQARMSNIEAKAEGRGLLDWRAPRGLPTAKLAAGYSRDPFHWRFSSSTPCRKGPISIRQFIQPGSGSQPASCGPASFGGQAGGGFHAQNSFFKHSRCFRTWQQLLGQEQYTARGCRH